MSLSGDGIPGMVPFPIFDVPAGDTFDAGKADQAIGHLYSYRSLTPAEVRGTSTGWTLTGNDLDTYWGYNSGSNTTWTIPIGINPPNQIGVKLDGSPAVATGGHWLIVEQHDTGQVTLEFAAGLTVIKRADLVTVRTDGVGTGLFVWYWPDDRALVSVRAF